MAVLSALETEIIARLASRASLASALLSAWRKLPANAPIALRSLTASAGLSVSDEQGAYEVLRELVGLNMVQVIGERYTALSEFQQFMERLAVSLSAIDYFSQNVHQDKTEAQVILTSPSQSSVLERQLEDRGWRMGSVEPTDQAFMALVQQAQHRVVIMTPFLDGSGARWLQELAENIRSGVSINLILRSLEDSSRSDYPVGFEAVRAWLAARDVKVFNYSIPRASGASRETFHAKAVLADRNVAYVGSANLTAASRDYSMEMGVVLRGKAAWEVSEVLDAVIRAATAVNITPCVAN